MFNGNIQTIDLASNLLGVSLLTKQFGIDRSETLGEDPGICILISSPGDSDAAKVWESLLSAVVLMPHPAGCSPGFNIFF